MSFIQGVSYALQGFKIISQKGLKRFVLIPLLINILFFAILCFVAEHYFDKFSMWFLHFLPHWLQWLSSILWIVFAISFVLIFFFTFTITANIVASPFNSFLAEKVEKMLSPTSKPPLGFFQTIKDIPRILGRQFAIIAYYLPRALLLLILFFIPVIQLFASVFWLFFNAWFMSLQYLDYPSDNQKVSFKDLRSKMAENRLLCLGFGTTILLLLFIPGVNFFVIPAAVAGATKMWIDEVSKHA